ncbi:MAG: hypothetical protein Q9221_004551 [Calogaya cf. arnoldii]
MLLWVLCLKLWWLTLPLSTLQHPSKLKGRITNEDLESRNAEITSETVNANVEDALEKRPPASLAMMPTTLDHKTLQPLPENGLLPQRFILNPLLLKFNFSGTLTNQSSNNPESYRGRDPYPVGPYPLPGRGSGRGPFGPDPGPYPPDPGPYPPGPYPPDPFPPGNPDVWAFDWDYPPFGSRKLFRLKGEINLKTDDVLLDIWILGYPVEKAGGNLDSGVFIDVSILVAKGYLKVYLVEANPKDEIWLLADLHLPFRQHFYKRIHMFNIPHHPGPPPREVSTA